MSIEAIKAVVARIDRLLGDADFLSEGRP